MERGGEVQAIHARDLVRHDMEYRVRASLRGGIRELAVDRLVDAQRGRIATVGTYPSWDHLGTRKLSSRKVLLAEAWRSGTYIHWKECRALLTRSH
ncbi:unnamed protein product [Polarella glacialis]|uniref:Uncharacterized protein n=1 Tax=Polarella glacialis TaxID=89957 RepID=A0A813IET2_POLGL|nr:unnamed protein product [Polarella glacialis]|mmetsp:Transcript_102341/g.184623  ORF Transcript_102341/g.184623 Transcript_102341/m.184623 type:complete len:96 (+) Transcript_102341:2891-3178(+)